MCTWTEISLDRVKDQNLLLSVSGTLDLDKPVAVHVKNVNTFFCPPLCMVSSAKITCIMRMSSILKKDEREFQKG